MFNATWFGDEITDTMYCTMGNCSGRRCLLYHQLCI